jgi:hypothetical protein
VQNVFFIQSHEYEKRLTAKLNVLAAFMRISNVHCADLSNWRIVMSIFDDAFSFAEHVGGSMVNDTAHLAEDGYKLATDSNYREQAWHSALNHVKAAANFGKAAIRSVDAAKDQLGSMINSGEQYLEKKVDDGRAWLRQHGGVAGQVLSDQVGFDEGIASSLYGAGKGLVQLADGVSSLTNPVEWAVNPDANIGRIKSAVNSAESLGKIAGLADPANWMADPRGEAQLAGALWNSAKTSFENDPAKFVGNVVGTIGTLAIPGADAAGAVADTAKVTELATDVSRATAITAEPVWVAGKAVHKRLYFII